MSILPEDEFCRYGHNEFDAVSGYLSGMAGRQVGLELRSERRTEVGGEAELN